MSFVVSIFKNRFFYLVLIILLSFSVRLYKINSPVADWHSWRQADTAAVARNFYNLGFTPFTPIYDDMSGVAEKPIPNPHRYRFVEFPIYNSLVYFAYLLNGGVNEALARLVTILISLGSLVFVYLIARKHFGEIIGLLAALLFGILPYNIYYSRVILPDPLMVFCSLAFFYFLERWIIEDKFFWYLWGAFFMAVAFLTKPMAIFYLLPLIYTYYQKEGKLWPIPKRYFLLAVPLIPFLGWRVRIDQHPEGIPASKWLFNGTHIRFRPAFFKWIIGDRFGREILSVTGTFLFFFGLLKKPFAREDNLLHFLALSSFLYLIVFATGNVQHDYYQILIIPALVIFTARGAVVLFKGIDGFASRIWTIPLAVLFLILTIYLGWQEVSGLYQINNPAIVEAGKEADKILPKNAVVVAPYGGDTSFLYQTNRPGWAFVSENVPKMVKDFGVTDFVSVAKDAETQWVMKKYTIIEENKDFVIVDLTKPGPLFNDKLNPEPF